MHVSTILLIATGTGKYASGNLPTGLWLSELAHIYHRAKKQGYEITVASPKGGDVPVDPESLKPLLLDKISRNYWDDPAFRRMLQHTESLNEISGKMFDCIYLAGGHGTMYDFPDNAVLQSIIKSHYESDKMVTAICHGVCGLLNVRLSGGEYLVRNKELTGYSWFEEILARREKEVPFNLEEALKERGADYRKAFIPMTSKVVVDGNLITGQNPFSSKEIAKVILRELEYSNIDTRN
ncbi:type 1 glutamine amidotransferase domain-containing protein [Barnesiella propionica]|uniref:type 1 glutamine amidotransferase domain-containing protein n=1 Tax=Barnesiella propionica TaxID=2981781 RepID=UPI0011CCDAE9|nr:type 1 glutamine amidotransferase domain-containing protein [Barnesiella propionica]MCU6769654.1 type 1 glutamine amidotransferase domain-containing protein [Barnesiella propionica]